MNTNQFNINYTRAEDHKRLAFIEKFINKNNASGMKVLDVGCGNGNISRFIGSFGCEVLGIDISADTIREAQNQTSLQNVQFKNTPAEELNVNEKFDLIVCSEVIEHLYQPTPVLQTLKNLLKPNGTLIVTVPNGFGPRELLITKPVQFISKNMPFVSSILSGIKNAMGYKGTTLQSSASDLTHVQFFSKSALVNLVGRNNLQLVDFGVSNFVEGVFPFSLISRKSYKFQAVDCKVADALPHFMSSGFMSAWKLK